MLVIGGNQSSGGFEVANSLIIDRASGAKITNTFGSTTNRRTFTVSLWTKKTNVSQEQNLVFAGDLSGSNPFFDFRFNSDQTVNWYQSDNSGSGAEFNLITNRKFTDVNAWFIKTDVPNGSKMFNRTPLQTKMEPDFDTGNLRFKARERYSFGVSDWRSWFGNQGA